jgi:[ribosomal protein S18]-alanine N-acetyltransferase
MSLTLRYMHPDDVPQVLEIDHASFPDSWGFKSYLFEINESLVSHMLVLTEESQPIAVPMSPLRQWFNRVRGKENTQQVTTIVAYGGLWRMYEESHISTIASRPLYRGKSYGELALCAMVRKALRMQADYNILEVRVNNIIAQNLYRKYGYVITDTRKHYYRDGEDAYEMRLDFNQPETAPRIEALYAQLQQKIDFVDQYTQILHPRLGN